MVETMQTEIKRKALQYLKPYRLQIFLAALLMLVEVGLNIWQPRLMASMIDDGVLRSQMDVILRSGGLMLAVAILGGIGGYASCVLSNTYAQRFGNDLRKATFERVMRMPAARLSDYSEGMLITRITTDTQVLAEFSAVLIQTLVKPILLFIFGSVMIFTVNRTFGLIVLLSVPIQIGIMLLFIRKTSPMFLRVQQKFDRLSTKALQLVSNNRLIKAYGREEDEADRFGDASRSLMQTSLKVQQLLAILNPLVMLLLNGVMLLILYAGGLEAEAGTARVGQIMAAISYAQQIMMALMMAGMVFQHIARSRASAGRVEEILSAEIAQKSDGFRGDGPISELVLEHVTFSYPGSTGGKPVLNDVNLRFARGERTLIVGATGSGKSTLAQLIARVYAPTGGRLLLNGRPLEDWSEDALRERLAVVFQNSDFFSGTVAENLCYGTPDAEEAEMRRAAEIAQVDDFITGLRRGYQSRVSERGLSLSGGQRQRVAIARALLRQPEILLLDDSTSSLDAETEQALYAALKGADVPIVIVVAQRMTGLLDAEQIVLLHEGRVEAVGTHEELLRSSERYQAIFASQCTQGGEDDE